MFVKFQLTIKYILAKLNLLDRDQQLSITNLLVYLFAIVTLFRLAMAGFTFTFPLFNWKVEDINVSVALPMLFSLLNYDSKRKLTNAAIAAKTKEGNDDQ